MEFSKKWFYHTSLLLQISSILAFPTKADEDRKLFSLDDFLYGSFSLSGFNGTWVAENEFIFRQGQYLEIFNVETLTSTSLLGPNIVSDYWGPSFTVSSDKKKVLVRFEVTTVFRHSTVAQYDIYDIEEDRRYPVHKGEKLQLCQWSPTGDRVAFVFDNNVYFKWSNSSDVVQLTQNGIPGIIYNGVADWVYEEEVLSSGSALWFSPDGKKIAIARFNDTEVETYTMPIYGEPEDPETQYPLQLNIKYPKPGTNNPNVDLEVIDLDAIEKGWQSLKAPTDIVTADHILQSVTWSDKDTVLAVWVNRRQNLASIQSCNVADGNNNSGCREVVRLNEPKGWIVISEPLCLSNGEQCLFTNWIGDWKQVWTLDLKSGENTEDPFGEYTVISIYGQKDSTKEIFYLATLKEDPSQRHVYRNATCLTCDIKGPEGLLCTYASASFSKNFDYASITCSGPTPAYTNIYSIKETITKIFTWEENDEKRIKLKEFQEPNVKYLGVPVEGGYKASVKLMLPPGIDFEAATQSKQYPMIVVVYGGPDSVRVSQAFSIGWDSYLVTSRNVTYAIIDGRGSGYKGKNMLYEINNRLGTVEINDQLAVTKHLRDTYKFIDPERIAIWGWSYGGYATAMALAKDDNRVFQCGISVAPVTAWIYYDSIYTERYMGLPTEEDNLLGYIRSDVTQDVADFQYHEFLLIHGTGDDNVHYQQSMALAKALQNETILFEEMSYPDEAHGLTYVQPHLYHTMDQFWTQCLNLDAVNNIKDHN